MDKSQKIKVVVAVVVLLAAIGIIAWWFTGSNSSGPQIDGVVSGPTPL